MSNWHREDCIYLDHPATTPCDPRVVDAMLPWMGARAANASQRLHAPGRAAAAAVDFAAAQVATAAGLAPESARVVWTSGATEANNLALLGIAGAAGPGSSIVISAVEHASVLAPARVLAMRGWDLRIVGVDEHGRLRIDELEAAIDDTTAIVSVQAANNETGVRQSLGRVGRCAREAGAVFHVDAVQSFGKVSLNPIADAIDLLSVSGHKVYGPTGIGALIATTPKTARLLVPITYGGGQEHGVRPGTTNVAGCVGFGEAARIARSAMPDEARRCTALRDQIETGLLARLPGAAINGSAAARLPGITSIELPGTDAAAMLAETPQIAASTTSACASGGVSHVLRAMGRTRERAASTVRLGVGRTTTVDDVDRAVEAVARSGRTGRVFSRGDLGRSRVSA